MGLFDFFDKPNAQPLLQPLQLKTAGQGLDDFLSQQGQYGDLQGFAQRINDDANQAWRGSLAEVSPNLASNVALFGQTTGDLLAGKIPADVEAAVRRSDAFGNLSRGVAGSNFGQALTARDLGLTSLDLMQRGQQALGQQYDLSAALTPSRVNGSQFLFTPQQLLQRSDQQDATNNQIANQNLQIQAANDARQSPFDSLIGNTIGSFVSTPFNLMTNANSVVASAPQMFAGAALGMLGGPGAASGGLSALFGSGGASAPYAAGWTQTSGGYVPRAAAVGALPY